MGQWDLEDAAKCGDRINRHAGCASFDTTNEHGMEPCLVREAFLRQPSAMPQLEDPLPYRPMQPLGVRHAWTPR